VPGSALIVFTKNPVAGKVKTRIAAVLGEDQALEIHQQLVRRTVKTVSILAQDIFVYYSDAMELSDIWDTLSVQKRVQSGESLGARMTNAFRDVLFAYEKVLCIGTDCPQLTMQHITHAFDALSHADIVIGPATDGGYYLIGMRDFFPWLFEDIAWSTGVVFSTTLKKCLDTGYGLKLLPVLSDVDTAKEWDQLSEFVAE
jgi:rSAM/selenodomain-associated transferase 1